MTEPNAQMTMKPSHPKKTPAPKKEKEPRKDGANDAIQVRKNQDHQDTTHHFHLSDKAALIALFTTPDDEASGVNTTVMANNALSEIPTSPVSHSDSVNERSIAEQRVALYHHQHQRTRRLYEASANTRPTYLIQHLKSQFIEYQHYQLAEQLDKRGLLDTESITVLWQQIHIIEDIIADIVRHMPAQQPAGWQLTTQEGRNPVCLTTIGKLKHDKPILDQASINSYVLGHFGVSSFTYDRGYYIGHVVGYLFCCYYCAHMSISYGVTALGEQVVSDYDYASLETPYMVRLLQGLDGYCKKRIYQLAVICARLSVYATDKRIEKMLIAEVNDFDKKLQQQHLEVLLSQGILPDSRDSTPLF